MVAPPEEQRAGPRDGLAVLHHHAVDELDAPTFPLHRGLNLHRLEQNRTQQVDRDSGRLQIRLDAGSLYPPGQQAANDLTAHRWAPRSSRQHARKVGVAVDSEERLGHDGGILDRHRYHDRTPDSKDRACSRFPATTIHSRSRVSPAMPMAFHIMT